MRRALFLSALLALPPALAGPAAAQRTMFLGDATSPVNPGADDERRLGRARGAALVSYIKNTLAGPVTPPTAATQMNRVAGGTPIVWYTPPLDAVTISGNVTFNFWAMESANQANAGLVAELLRADSLGNILSIIAPVAAAPTRELGTAIRLESWTATPSPTALANGDRLALRLYIDDAGGNMGSGRTVTMTIDGPTAAASGDSWFQTAENLAPARPAIGSITSLTQTGFTASWTLVEETTGYTLAVSPNPANPPSPISASVETANNSVSLSSLIANTTYHPFLRSNTAGISSSWAAYPVQVTPAHAPSFTSFTGLAANSMQFNWAANGNHAATRYHVVMSTAADPLSPFGAPVTSSFTFNTFLSSATLLPNTEYNFRVAAVNHAGVYTAYTPIISAYTLANAPAAGPFSGVSGSGLTASWTAGGNPGGTMYRLLVSTAPNPLSPAGAAVSQHDTANIFFSTAGLALNTTYFFRAAAVNGNGVASAYFAAVSTATLAAAPVFSGFSGAAWDSLTFNWTSGGNPAGTLYRVVSSTAPDPLAPAGALAASSNTFNLALSSAGLAADARYYFRAAAVNHNGVVTAYTAPENRATLLRFDPAAPVFGAVGETGMIFSFSANGNAGGTLFRVISSTAPDPLTPAGAAVVSSDTYNSGLSLTGLTPNVTYFFRAAGVNKDGIPTNYTAAIGTSTLAAVPSGLDFPEIAADRLRLDWVGGNGPGALYRVLVSTAPDPANPGGAAATSSDTYNLWLATAGLAHSTTYFFRARAVNNNGVITAWSAIISTRTLPPGALAAPLAGALTAHVSSMTASWSLVGGATGYTLAASLFPDNPPVVVAASSETAAQTSARVWGLLPDTIYHLFIRANGAGVASAWNAYDPKATLLEHAPAFGSFTGVSAQETALSWTSGGNPAGTLYRVLSSTAADPLSPAGARVVSSDTFNLSLSSAGLRANTAHYFRIAGVNKDGVTTVYTAARGTSTLADMPGFSGFSGVGASAVTFAWTAGGNPGGTLYRVLSSTAPDPLSPAGAAVVSSDTFNLSLSTAGLRANTTYYFRAAAVNQDGIVSVYDTVRSSPTLPAAPSFPGFGAITDSAIDFLWSGGDNPADTIYRVLSSTAPDPLSPAGAPVVSSDTFNLFLSSSGLAVDSIYYFRAAALGRNGQPAGWTAPQRGRTLARQPGFSHFSGVGPSSTTANWSANGNPAGTLYRVAVSTAPDPLNPAGARVTLLDSFALSASSAGLRADTTHFFRVAGVNGDGAETAYTAARGTATLAANPPLFQSFSDITADSIRIIWEPNGNAPDTVYRVAVSTAADPLAPAGARVSFSDTQDLSLSTHGLITNTVYHFRLAAVNKNNVATQYTAAQSVRTLQTSTVLYLHDSVSAANPDAGEERRLLPARGAASVEYTRNTAAGPVTPPTAATQFTRAAAGAVQTWYTMPLDAVTIVSSVTFNLRARESAAAANATVTAELYRANNSGAILSTIVSALIPRPELTTADAAQTWTREPVPTALSNGDRLALRVFIDDGNGVTMAAGNTVVMSVAGPAAHAAGDSWVQVLEELRPARPASLTITGVTASQISAAWPLVSEATGYMLAASANPGGEPAPVYSSSRTLGDLSAMLSNPAFLPDTTYYLFVRSESGLGAGAWTAHSGTATLLAFAPAAAGFTGVGASALQFNWAHNGNAPGTLYRVVSSTAPDPLSPGGAVAVSSLTFNTFLSTAGLSADTTYFFRVAGVNRNGVETAYTAAAGTATLLAFPPAFSNFSDMGTNAMRFNWAHNGNAPGTLYRVVSSTAPDPLSPGGAVAVSSLTFNTFLSTAGLSADTTYFFRVAGVNRNGVETAYTAAAGTATLLAFPPAFSNFSNVWSGSVTYNWAHNGNAPGTLYRVVSSTAPDPLSPGGAVAVSSLTFNTFLSTAGLSADTTYFFRVAGVNRNGVETAYTAAAGTATLLAFPPEFANFSNMGTNAMRFNWAHNGNAPGTLYRVVSSTAPDPLSPGGAVAVSSLTFNTHLSSAGLRADTTYFFRVAGVNRNGVETAYTAARGTSTLANMPSGLFATGVTEDFIQLNWPAGGNRDPGGGAGSPAGTLYRVLTSTAADPLSASGAVVTSSDTYNLHLSTPGLSPSTVYYFRAAAVNNNGVLTAWSDPPFAQATLAPGSIGSPASGEITEVRVSSLAASWSLVAGATGYTLAASLSADNPPSAIVVSSDTQGALNSAWLEGLAADTVYYLFARANKQYVSGDWLALGPRATLLGNPPVFVSFSGVTAAAAQFNFGANGNAFPGTLFRVLTSTAPDPLSPGGAIATSSDTYNLSLASSSLRADTTYFFRAAGVNKDGVLTAYTAVQATATAANIPVFSGFTGVGAAALTFNWSANGNRNPGTLYRVLSSTAPDPLNPGGAPVASSDTFNLSLSAGGLAADTTYFFRVAALGAGGSSTGYSAPAGTATLLAFPPAFSNFSDMGTNAMRFNWAHNGNAPGTLYRVVSSTAPDPLSPGGAVAVSSLTFNTFLSTAGLSANTTYFFRVAGVNRNGVETAYTAVAGTATLADIPLTAVSTFSAVAAGGFTAAWAPNSNPPGTLYQAQVSTAPDFNAGAHGQTASTIPAAGHSFAFSGLLSSRDYHFRVRAVNRNGVHSDYAGLGSTRTLRLPAPVISPIAQVSTFSITASWTLVAGATGYTLAASVNPGVSPEPIYASSAAAGGQAAVLSPALALNTTYYLFVRAGGPGDESLWAAYPATSTLANTPTAPGSPFDGVTDSGFTVSWGANGNALGETAYTVQLSTAIDFNAGVVNRVALTTAPAAGPAASFGSLTSDTWYHARVRAHHNNGAFTAWVSLGSVKTLILAEPAAAGDGVLFYGQSGNSTPQFRNYRSATNSFGAVLNTVAGAAGRLFTMRTSPLTTKQEAVAAYVSNGTLRVLCTDGANWYEEWSQSVGGVDATRRFDIAFERRTGDVVVLYSRNVSGTSELGWRAKPGAAGCGAAGWSAENLLDPVRTSGIVHWVRLAPDRRADRDFIAAVWADANSDLSAMVWNGAAWENEPAAALETSLETVSAAQDVESFAVETESLSGNIMVVWGNSAGADGVNGVRYATAAFTGAVPAHAWGNSVTPAVFADDATNMDLAADPATNRMVFAAIGNAASHMQAGHWSGSSWTSTANLDTTCATPVAGTKLVAAAWISSGTATRSVIAYNDAAATNVGWYTGAGGGFTAQTDWAPAPAFGNPQRYYELEQDPVHRDRLILAVADGNADLFAKRLIMNEAAAFTWSNADGGAALETNLGSALSGGYSYVFWPSPPATVYEQSAYRFFANADSTNVGAPLAAQDALAALPAAGSAFRLRALLTIGQVDLPISGQSFKLQFAGQGSGTCAEPAGGSPAAYTDVTGATLIAYNNNPAPADKAALTANANDPVFGAQANINQVYAESGNFSNSAAGIARNRNGLWDLSLRDNGMAPGAVYCLRLVKNDGLPLEYYTHYPRVVSPAAVLLNELYPSGASAAEDWVELYNNSQSTVPLLGWSLGYVQNTIAIGGSANTVWTGGADQFVNAQSTFLVTGLSLDLNAAQSYHLRLLDAGGGLVNQAQWPAGLQSSQSFARVSDGHPDLFEIDPTPTRGYANAVSTDALTLNEIAYGALGAEFAELYSSDAVSTRTLTGYALRNAASSAAGKVFRFTRRIFPRDFAALDASSLGSGGLTWPGVFGADGLSAAGDFLTLENSTGSTVNTVAWQSGAAHTRYNFAAQLTAYANPAPANAANSIVRGPSDGAHTGTDSADFSASTGTTLASRNNNAGTAAANTLSYPDPSGGARFLSRRFPLRLTLGADASAGRGNNLVLSRRGGAADGNSPHIYRLEDIGFSLSSMLEQSTAQFGLSFPDQDGNSLVDGALYRLILNSDTGAASAPQVVIASAAYDASIHSVSAYGPPGPSIVNNEAANSAVRIDILNNSPAGFNGVEIATVSFRLFAPDLVTPLPQQQARDLFDAVMLVADSTHTGLPGTYEPAIDVATAAWVPMGLITLDDDGRSTLTVATAGLGASFVAAGSTRPFYLVFVTTQNASAREPDNAYRVRFDPASGIRVRDASGLLGQDFVPGAQVDTASFTVIAPALPPPDTLWPYVTESSAPITGGVVSWVGAPLAEGRLYLPSSDGTVVALSTTGARRWTFTTSPLTSVGATPSFPAKEGAELYLYFTGANGDVYKVEDEGGSARQAWKVSLGAAAISVLDTDARVYVPTADKRVHCLNKSDGSACSPWTFSSAVTAAPAGLPSVDERATVAMAWIGLEDGRVVSIKTGDGTSDNSFQTGGPIRSSPYLDAYAASPDNALYVTSTDGIVYAINSGNMTAMSGWNHYAAGSPIRTSPFVWPLGGTKYVFFGADNGRLYKLNAASGALVWSFQAGGAIRSSPVVVPSNFHGLGLPEGEDYVYFGCDDGKIYAVNGNTGALRAGWPVSTGGPVRADPVYDPDARTISVGSNDGRLYTLYVGP